MSNPNIEQLENTISAYINTKYKEVPPTEEEFIEKAASLRKTNAALMPVTDQEFTDILKRLRQSLVIQMDVGVYINDQNNGHQSWLPAKRDEFDFFFWNRYKKYLEEVKHASYESGKTLGYDTGYVTGKSQGYSDGYASGHVAGQKSVSSTSNNETAAKSFTAKSFTEYVLTRQGQSSQPSTVPVVDPDSSTVYVSNNKKIHRRSNCSGMKKYKEIDFSEAISYDYELCPKCYPS